MLLTHGLADCHFSAGLNQKVAVKQSGHGRTMPERGWHSNLVFRYQYANSVGFNVGSFDISGNDCAGA